MGKDFSINLTDKVLAIVLGEQLSTDNATLLMEELKGYNGTEIEKVLFDAAKMTYITSNGIRAVIFAKQKLGGNPTIEFKNCPAEIRNVFEMTGLQNYITFTKE